MRNLKRVLSLALATVMLLGMMVIGAGAADAKKEAIKASDLTDMATVVNKDAVALMVDLGIVEGKPDKTYDPKGIVDRATMAKLVYKVLMGTTDESIYKGTSTGLTDISANWAEGFINYCYSVDIIAGIGDNKFDPSGKVTVASAAKMLLVALGYDAKDRGYVGNAQWSVNIMKDAQAMGLIKGVDQKANDSLTRDNAAQMIYNALFAKTRAANYDRDMGEKYIKDYTVHASTLGLETYGLVKYVVTVNDLTPSLAFSAISPKLVATATSTQWDSAKAIAAMTGKDAGFTFSANMLATNVAVYAKVTYELTSDLKDIASVKFVKLYSTKLAAADTAVLATSTNGTGISGYSSSVNDLTTKNSKNKGYVASLAVDPDDAKEYKVSYFVNGTAATDGGDATILTYAAPTAAQAAAKLKGAVVEFIDSNDDGKAEIVKITKKTVATLSADATTRVQNDILEVKVPGVVNAFVDAKKVNGYADLKKGDVVLYTKVNDVYTIEKAEMVEGIVAAKDNSNKIKIDGVSYAASGLGTVEFSTWEDWTNTYKFYLDNGKNVIKTEKVTSKTADSYAYVIDTAWVAGVTLDAGSYAQAKLLFTDGTTKVVTVSKVDKKTIIAPIATDTAGTAGKIEFKWDVDGVTPGGEKYAINKGQFYAYAAGSDEKYELTTKSNTALDATPDNGKIVTNNKAAFDGANVGNSATVFLVATTSGTKTVYKAYTGIAAVPTLTGTVTGTMLKDKSVATFVFADATTGTVAGIDSDAVYVYVPNTAKYVAYGKTTDHEAYLELTAYVDGTKVEDFRVTDTTVFGGKNNAVFTTGSKNNDGAYTSLTYKGSLAEAPNTGIIVASGGTLAVGTPTATYTYNSDSVIYFINSDKELSIATDFTLDKTDKVMVVANTNGYVTRAFVWDVDTADTAVVSVDGYVNGVKTVFSSKTGVTAGTFASCKVGDVITIKAVVSDEATYATDVASYTLVASDANVAKNFELTITAEDGTSAKANFAVTVTAVNPK